MNAQDEHGYSCMHAAASYGHVELLQYLVQSGGNVNIRVRAPKSHVMSLSWGESRLSVRIGGPMFLGSSIEPPSSTEPNDKHPSPTTPQHHQQDPDGDTPLHVCEELATAQALVGFGADPQARNFDGKRVRVTVPGRDGGRRWWDGTNRSTYLGDRRLTGILSLYFRVIVPSRFNFTQSPTNTSHKPNHNTQPHDAAAENGYLELCNYLRGVCGLEALEQLPDEEGFGGDGDDGDMGDDSPNQQDAQEEEEEEEAMAE